MLPDYLFAGTTIAAIVACLFSIKALREELYRERKRTERFLAALLMQRNDYGPARVVQDKQKPVPDKEDPLTRSRQIGMSIR